MSDAVAAAAFGRIEGAIGLVHKVLRLAGPRGQRGDPAAGRHRAVRPGPPLDRPAGSLGHAAGDVPAYPREQHGELLPAVAGNRVVPAGDVAEHVGDPAQGDVPGRVAEGIVVRLEVVHVQQHQRERRFLAGGQGELSLQLLEEPPPVLQPGQLVGRGQGPQLLVLPLQLLLHGNQALGDPQPGDQLPGVDRLGQEVVGPGGQRLQAFVVPPPGRDHDDVGVRPPVQAPDAAAQLKPVRPRHHPVGEHQVHAAVLEQGPGLDAIGRRDDLVAQRGEEPPQDEGRGRVVLNDQDRHRTRFGPGPRRDPTLRHPVRPGAREFGGGLGVHLGVIGAFKHRSPLLADGVPGRFIGGMIPGANTGVRMRGLPDPRGTLTPKARTRPAARLIARRETRRGGRPRLATAGGRIGRHAPAPLKDSRTVVA